VTIPNTSSPTQATPAAQPTSRGLKWPVLIIGLLALNIGVCLVTVIAATANPPIIEPDYYEKGLKWDEQRDASGPTTTPKTTSTAATKD